MEDEWLVITLSAPAEQSWRRLALRLIKAIRLAAKASYAGTYLNWWQRRGEAVCQYRQLESSANLIPRHLDPRKHLLTSAGRAVRDNRPVAIAKAAASNDAPGTYRPRSIVPAWMTTPADPALEARLRQMRREEKEAARQLRAKSK